MFVCGIAVSALVLSPLRANLVAGEALNLQQQTNTTQTRDAGHSVAPVSQTASSDPGTPATIQITGPDGKPLPPELQREIERSIRQQGKAISAQRAGSGEQSSQDHLGNTIVVTGARPRGSAAGNVLPDRTFSATDILAFGADNLEALLKVLAPQGLGRGDSRDTAVVINGKRVSTFAEIATLPAEAIQRIEILPEAAALSLGFPNGQKLINVVTLERYISKSGQIGFSAPTDGGHLIEIFRPQYLFINGDTRLNIVGSYSKATQLLESQRGISDQPQRTLLPRNEEWSLKPSFSGTAGDISYNADAQYSDMRQDSLFGISDGAIIKQSSRTETTHIGSIFSGKINKFNWSATVSGDIYSIRAKNTDSEISFLRNSSSSKDIKGSAELFLNGKMLDMPAGPLYLSARSTSTLERLTSSSLEEGTSRSALRSSEGVQLNIDVPISGRTGACNGAMGCLIGHLNTETDFLSDAGTLFTLGYGLNWRPVSALNFNASFTRARRAPALDQLASSLVFTPNTLIYDATQGKTVTINELSGGNSKLRTSDYHTIFVGVMINPFSAVNMTFNGDITHSRIANPVINFSIVDAQLESAFPGRFVRDTTGQLTQIDTTPSNGLRSEQTDVHASVSFSRPIGSAWSGNKHTIVKSIPNGDIRGALPPGATIIMAEPGSAADKLLDDTESRLYISAIYTLHMQMTLNF